MKMGYGGGKGSKASKMNKIARSRAGGDASRGSVPPANSSVTNRTEANVTGKRPARKARVRR